MVKEKSLKVGNVGCKIQNWLQTEMDETGKSFVTWKRITCLEEGTVVTENGQLGWDSFYL